MISCYKEMLNKNFSSKKFSHELKLSLINLHVMYFGCDGFIHKQAIKQCETLNYGVMMN